ncbi:hypothetical protein PENTCL1PPCAC_12240, partial [Pristionchus entomophagus]
VLLLLHLPSIPTLPKSIPSSKLLKRIASPSTEREKTSLLRTYLNYPTSRLCLSIAKIHWFVKTVTVTVSPTSPESWIELSAWNSGTIRYLNLVERKLRKR